jgi:hypothetical protein
MIGSALLGRLSTRYTGMLLALCLALASTGCTPLMEKEDARSDQGSTPQGVQLQEQSEERARLKREIIKLQEQLSQSDSEVARLQLKLLEKQAEINRLEQSRQLNIQEVVRTKAKLRSRSSKAQAVANMAEVKMTLKAVGAAPLNEQQRSVVQQAEKMMGMSDVALEEGNVDGASYLSSEAMQLVQPIHARLTDQKDSGEEREEVVFATPLAVKVLTRCNIRSAPNLDSKVLLQLDSGTLVQALAYSENWIKIEIRDKGRGWVYYQLLGMEQ